MMTYTRYGMLFVMVILLWGCRSRTASSVATAQILEEYPALVLPFDTRMTNPDQEKIWKTRELSASSAALFESQGQGYAIGKIAHSSGLILCATFFESNAAPPKVVLSTHTAQGDRVDELVFAQDARENQLGYGGSLSSSFKIFRLEMFYVIDERTGQSRPEADHEDVYAINEEGKFIPSTRD